MEGEVSKSFKLKNDNDLEPVVHPPLKRESAGIVHKQGNISAGGWFPFSTQAKGTDGGNAYGNDFPHELINIPSKKC